MLARRANHLEASLGQRLPHPLEGIEQDVDPLDRVQLPEGRRRSGRPRAGSRVVPVGRAAAASRPGAPGRRPVRGTPHAPSQRGRGKAPPHAPFSAPEREEGPLRRGPPALRRRRKRAERLEHVRHAFAPGRASGEHAHGRVHVQQQHDVNSFTAPGANAAAREAAGRWSRRAAARRCRKLKNMRPIRLGRRVPPGPGPRDRARPSSRP